MSQLNQLANMRQNYTNINSVFYNCISNLNWIRINPISNPKLHGDKPVTGHLNRHGITLEFLLHAFLQIYISVNFPDAKQLQTVVDNLKTALYASSMESMNQVKKQLLCDIQCVQPVHPETRLSLRTWNSHIILNVLHVCIGSSTVYLFSNICLQYPTVISHHFIFIFTS